MVVMNTYHPNLIAVSETWFKSFSIVNVPGYNILRRDRSDGCRGGGVCLYIENSIDSYELLTLVSKGAVLSRFGLLFTSVKINI
jgi:hypothetical protein